MLAPMPPQNIIAAHEPVLNSTSSAGLPSLMLPISEAAIYTTNTTANTPKAK